MFQTSLNLLDISRLREPTEVLPLGEQEVFKKAQEILKQGGFKGSESLSLEKGSFSMQLFIEDKALKKLIPLRVLEKDESSELDFLCRHCLTSIHSRQSCEHQWAAFLSLWLACQDSPAENLLTRSEGFLDLQKDLQLALAHTREKDNSQSDDVKLDSITIFLTDECLNGREDLEDFPLVPTEIQLKEVHKEEESLAPTVLNLPEVFRKKLIAYSEVSSTEVHESNRLAQIVRYNFSNGVQLTSQDILRHPLYRQVPRDLLPQAAGRGSSVFARWPLLQKRENYFISQNLRETEEVIQNLLNNIAIRSRMKQVAVYLQLPSFGSSNVLPLKEIDFESGSVFQWRVSLSEKKDLLAEFQLIAQNKQYFHFFESFALDPSNGQLLVHPWVLEEKSLRDLFRSYEWPWENIWNSTNLMPQWSVESEHRIKTALTHLRKRALPVEIEGETHQLEAKQTVTEIHLDEQARYFLLHKVRVFGQKEIFRRGWTGRSLLFLNILTEGLGVLFPAAVRDSKSRRHREWDLKLLRHLGILQYVTLETLSQYFTGALTNGLEVPRDQIVPPLYERLQKLLVTGSGAVLVQDVPLEELCSKTALSYLEDYTRKIQESLTVKESFYSEAGEVQISGLVEREFRLLFEILKSWGIQSGGDNFKKSRTGLLSKTYLPDSDQYKFPITGDEDRALQETIEACQDLLLEGFQVYFKDQPLQELSDEDFKVDFDLQSNRQGGDFNWFELNPRFFLMGQEVNPDDMKNFGGGGVIEHQGKLYLVPKKQLPSIRRLEKFWIKLQKGKKEAPKKKFRDYVYQLPRHQILELLALRASGYGIRGDEEWKSICEFYDNLGQKDVTYQMPPSIKAELKPYQILGIQWLKDLYGLRLGALLADDMGLGKTLQTLSFLEDLRLKGELGQVLIVVPSSLIFNWQSEIEKFVPELPMTVFASKDLDRVGKRLEAKEDLVVITTYGLAMEQENFFAQYKWRVLIFDEAQNLKNITTKRTSAARALNAHFKICLTGTPMENHYGEFYSLVDILVPGSLGKIEDFRRRFVNKDSVAREEIEDLKLKIRPLLLRRTKKEILDQLPEKQETKVSIAFEQRQMEIYRDIALSYNQSVQEAIQTQGEAKVQLQMLTALLRLRQACSDPGALPNINYDKVPPKIETLRESIQEIVESGESVLVFTQFLQTLEHTAKVLSADGIPVFTLHGGIPTKSRQKVLSDFNTTPGGAVLLMTLKTGGVGLNLTKASYVFHLEPWWNPSVENQATDRAHRLGQNKAVQVFRYIMHESLEEKIEQLKGRKEKKFQSLFAETEADLGMDLNSSSPGLTKSDFDLLLGINR